jgi:chromosome segregation ATPase
MCATVVWRGSMEEESKYKDAQKHIKLLETRLHDLNLQLAASNSEKDRLHATINKHKEKIDSLLFNSKKLEKENASLMERYADLEKISEQTKPNSVSGFLRIIFA